MLKNDSINASTVTFSEDDRCGNSESHAQQLHDIVRKFKTETGANQINISSSQ